MSPEELLERIRERLATGEIPRGFPQRLWAGYGTGQTCAVCDAAIMPGSVEIEAHGADDKFRYYHRECYNALADERTRQGG